MTIEGSRHSFSCQLLPFMLHGSFYWLAADDKLRWLHRGGGRGLRSFVGNAIDSKERSSAGNTSDKVGCLPRTCFGGRIEQVKELTYPTSRTKKSEGCAHNMFPRTFWTARNT